MFHPRRARRALSPILATVILIAITIAGGLLVFSMFESSASTQQLKAIVDIESAQLIAPANSNYTFVLVVKNVGSLPITNMDVVFAGLDLKTPGLNPAPVWSPLISAGNPLTPGMTAVVTYDPLALMPPTFEVSGLNGSVPGVLITVDGVDYAWNALQAMADGNQGFYTSSYPTSYSYTFHVPAGYSLTNVTYYHFDFPNPPVPSAEPSSGTITLYGGDSLVAFYGAGSGSGSSKPVVVAGYSYQYTITATFEGGSVFTVQGSVMATGA